MRKGMFRHWKRETLEQVQVQGLQLEELQQAVVKLQNVQEKILGQQREIQIKMEELITGLFETNREWQEKKLDGAFAANQQWQESLLRAEGENQRTWENEKIDSAFAVNQQWQESLLRAEGENQRTWEHEKIDSAFAANQQWQESLLRAKGESQQKWESEKIDSAFAANQKWQETVLLNQQKWIYSRLYEMNYQNSQNTDTMMSALNNLLSLKVNWEKDKTYRYFLAVRDLMRIYKAEDTEMMRVGRAYDGGYVMVRPFSTEKIAYSIGISDDTSWDHDMADRGYEVFQYDHTIDTLPEENAHFHWKKIGIGPDNRESVQTLATMLNNNNHTEKRGMVLKIDVEGHEWEVFASAEADILDQFDQIVVEFHHVLSEKNKLVLPALRKIRETHVPVHIHGNNYGKVAFCGDLMMPDLLEVTFVNRKTYHVVPAEGCSDFPTDLDYPNQRDVSDIRLKNWNRDA